ncbi:hypothetical protein [Cryptosporangium sp. NPDC048952]|uniref:hypothetical protein n=1 Tax=Cryptosporangium sp. NPDC048952 TaxID=3363961 RepID=UPI0037194803
MHRGGLLVSGMAALLLVAGCGDDSDSTARSAAATGTTSAPSATVSASASPTTSQGDRFSALPPCNEFPAELAGTFQGSVIQVVPSKKAGDTWAEGAACIAMVAAARQPLSMETYLFQQGSDGQGSTLAATYAAAKAPAAETIAGWGDDALWSASSCQLAVRYSNVVAFFRQLRSTPNCRATIEPIARGFTALHLK